MESEEQLVTVYGNRVISPDPPRPTNAFGKWLDAQVLGRLYPDESLYALKREDGSPAFVSGTIAKPVSFSVARKLTLGGNVAKPPVVISSKDGPTNKAAEAMQVAASTKGSFVKKSLKGLAAYVAVDQAFEHAPEAYLLASEYFAKSGVDIHQLAVDASAAIRGTVVDQLLKKGLDVSYIEGANLDAIEASAYKNLLRKYRNTADTSYAEGQAGGATTGNEELDRIAKNLDIERICRGLGISSSLYATILRGVNTHNPDDIEAFQLHRRMYGLQAI